MCPGARRWHAGPADGALWSNTAMCESEYDAATRDDPFGANAKDVIPRRGREGCATAFPQRSSRYPALAPGSASAITATSQSLRSRRTSQSFTRPSAAPAESRTCPSCANAAEDTEAPLFAVFVFVFVFPLISRASSCARSTAATGRAAGSPASPRARETARASHSASAPSLPHDANTSPPLPGRTATALTVPRWKRNAPSSAAVSTSKSRAVPSPDAVTRRSEPRHHRVSNTALSCARNLRLTSNEGNADAFPKPRNPSAGAPTSTTVTAPSSPATARSGEFGVAEPSSRRQKRTTNGASGRSSAASAPYPSDTETEPQRRRGSRVPSAARPAPGKRRRAARRSKNASSSWAWARGSGAPDTKSRTPGRSVVLLAVRTSSRPRRNACSDAWRCRGSRAPGRAEACAEVVATCSR